MTTYGSFIRRSTCGLYRIAIFCLISYRIYRFLLWLYRAITTRLHSIKGRQPRNSTHTHSSVINYMVNLWNGNLKFAHAS